MGLSSPLPCPRTARRSGCKGARNAREPATNPCSPTGASGSHLRSFASHAKVGKGGANRKCVPEAETLRGSDPPDMCGRFPSLQTGRVSPIIVSAADQTGTSPLAPGPNRNEERCREELKPTMLIRRIAARGSWR
jgi:hypothetical protein